MPNISPGVYTKIIDLGTFVQAVPASIGFICGLSPKGEDNKLKFLGGRAELIREYGEPDITVYGKYFGQGLYNAYNFLGESGALYFIRPLPDDATFSNLRIDAKRASDDSSAEIQVSYVSTANTTSELKTNLESSGDVNPIGVLYPIGRGNYYNGLSVRFTEFANPLANDIYVLDIYERQSDGDYVIIESFDVSFDPNSKDSTGDSNWISYVLNQYSSVLRFDQVLSNDEYTDGYKMISKVFDQEIGTVTLDDTIGSTELTDNKQDFSDWSTTGTTADYVAIVKDDRGNEIWGWLGAASNDDETVEIYDTRFLNTASRDWSGETTDFDFNSTSITYQIKRSISKVSEAFTSSVPVSLKRGSDGSLIDAQGNLDTTVANQVLSQAYSGLIDDDVLDQENIYFNLVFDCGYQEDVKDQISSMVQTRRDCVAILDNGDNPTFNAAISSREDTFTYNSYLVALYEGYNKVYDQFTGQDIWVSPLYHMSYLLPRNDNVAEIWWAAAGLQRGAIGTIDELRYNPRLGQRDQLYLKQLNPIVKFNEGYTVWGQLTTQAKPSARQDLNITRLVLYIQRAFERFSRFYIFELNDQITWNAVATAFVEFLEQIKRRRGLYSYSVEVSATEYEIKRKTFHANILLFPTRVVEKIELNFFLR